MFDLLIYNAKIYSFDKDDARYSAMLICDGKVAALSKGSDFGMELKVNEISEIIDMKGMVITPSFIYPRAHLGFGALFYCATDIGKLDCVSLQEKTTTDDLLFEMKALPSPGLFKSRIFYNFDPKCLRAGERFTIEEVSDIFGKSKIAIFSRDLKSGFFSPDVFDALGLDYRDYGGVLTKDDFLTNFKEIYSYLYKQQAASQIPAYAEYISNKYLEMGYTFMATIDGIDLLKDDCSIAAAQRTAEAARLSVMNFEYPLSDYLHQINKGFLFGENSPVEQISLMQENMPRQTKYILSFLTREAARALDIEEEKGSLEINKDADLLVFTTNPMKPKKDNEQKPEIAAVMMDGKFVKMNQDVFPKDDEE